jgi:hypothetical protein
VHSIRTYNVRITIVSGTNGFGRTGKLCGEEIIMGGKDTTGRLEGLGPFFGPHTVSLNIKQGISTALLAGHLMQGEQNVLIYALHRPTI